VKQRLRWFALSSSGAALPTLLGRVRGREYDESTGIGFRIERSGRNIVKGDFIERIEHDDAVEDPFGRVMRFQRTEFRTVRFHFGTEYAQLELVDPPRSTKVFLSTLSEVTEYQLVVEPIRPDVSKWIKALEQVVGRLRVRDLEVSGVTLSATASASVVVSGGADVRKDARRLLGDLKGELVGAALEWRQGDDLVNCEISKHGATFDDAAPNVGTILRETLRSVVLQQQQR